MFREFFYPSADLGLKVSPKSMGKRLKNHVDEAVLHGEHTLILRAKADPKASTDFHVEEKAAASPEGV